MSTAENTSKRNPVSLDTWAVITALLLALAVRFDILKNVSVKPATPQFRQ
jgi:hypothetical protein